MSGAPRMQPANPVASDFVDPAGVDLARPLFAQVADLGASYFDWVHAPVPRPLLRRLAARPGVRWAGSVRIFGDDRLEAMTHIPWQLVLAIWAPVVVALPVLARRLAPLSALATAGLLVAGFFVWTFAEYVLHRWGFHTPPRSRLGIRVHFLAHGIHHLDPTDGTRLVFPPLLGVGIAAVLFGLVSLVLPVASALVVMSGLLAGYLVYDMSHYVSHHGRVQGSPWLRFLARYHNAHHHREPEAKYGVSNPLWDMVFRTGGHR